MHKNFDQLPLYFEGNSRILKQAHDEKFLIGKLKPTVFSLQEKGPVVVPGIENVRTELNAILCAVLHQQEVKTSTLETEGDLILMEKHEVPPIEVVVKGALIGSPKHIYKGIDQCVSRFHKKLIGKHAPYVRFDWRNALPLEDSCMPTGLADYFIDTEQASKTALKAFTVLNDYLKQCDLELFDVCFFMNTSGDVICAEVSTDNTRIGYLGQDPAINAIFASKEKQTALERAKIILGLLRKYKDFYDM